MKMEIDTKILEEEDLLDPEERAEEQKWAEEFRKRQEEMNRQRRKYEERRKIAEKKISELSYRWKNLEQRRGKRVHQYLERMATMVAESRTPRGMERREHTVT